MLKTDAISIHVKKQNWNRFPVFVWQENDDFVTKIDGMVFRARNIFKLDSMLSDGSIPMPRNLYFVDAPDYESDSRITTGETTETPARRRLDSTAIK